MRKAKFACMFWRNYTCTFRWNSTWKSIIFMTYTLVGTKYTKCTCILSNIYYGIFYTASKISTA